MEKFKSTKFVMALLSLLLSTVLAFSGKLTYEFVVIVLGLNGVYSGFRWASEYISNGKAHEGRKVLNENVQTFAQQNG